MILTLSCATLVFPRKQKTGEPKGEPWHQAQSVQRSCSRRIVPGGVLWNSGLVGSEGKKIGNGWYLGYIDPCDIPT